MVMARQQAWFSEWDYLSKLARAALVIQVGLAFAFIPIGIWIAITQILWFGLVFAGFSVGWLIAQRFSYQQLLKYRRAGG